MDQSLISKHDTYASFYCFYRYKRFEDKTDYPHSNGIDRVCGPLPIALLLVSHAIYKETMAVLHSENRFKICRTGSKSLTALFRLALEAIRNLTSLHVPLNACSCVPGHICRVEDDPGGILWEHTCTFCHSNCKRGTELALSSQDTESEAVVDIWQQTIRHLWSSLNHSQLRLSIVCDTLDYSVAIQMLKSMQGQPQLASCAIRLSKLPDHLLRSPAENTIQKATGDIVTSSNSFPWVYLPNELQLRILSYTDLVASKEILWDERHSIRLPGCCRQCMDSLETCCCPGLHAGSSSLGCQCWHWPSDLFLVNKKLRSQAVLIAYSFDTFFIITELHDDWSKADIQRDHRDLLTFFHSFPRDAVCHIRSLYIFFFSKSDYSLQAGTTSLTQWAAALELIRENFLPSSLYLSVGLFRSEINEPDYVPGYIVGGIEEDEWNFHQRLAASMKILYRIRYLGLNYPYQPESERAARNRLRECQLRRQLRGHLSADPDTITLVESHFHPYLDHEPDKEVVYGPAGERLWPLVR